MVANHLENIKIQDMNTKKKILVVDDTPANLDAAKAYFANNTDYEFVYATNREEGEKVLPECDALITDAQMPFNENSKALYLRMASEEKFVQPAIDLKIGEIMESNGCLLAIEAYLEGKTAIIVSHHGKSLTTDYLKADTKIQKIEEYKEKFNGLGLSWFKKFSGNEFEKPTVNPGFYSRRLSSERTVSDELSKENSSGWEFAFTKLCEEFKLNEQPKEIQKIKLQ